ncbi:HAD family hydrolase [Nocardiopsis sp. NPDC050513]|uniref:HAD family hydrolase n=1 Tax=Nocardiopsis sp. NPDC050513 TaxID=3364338 RepID=UPI0037BD35A4
MSPSAPLLISVDVGGTLGTVQGQGLSSSLVQASPLPPRRARAIMRDLLHTSPIITDELVATVCAALHVPVSDFPRDLPAVPLTLFPGTLEALQALSRVATVVTLSNVTCQEADTERLRTLLAPWVSGFYPSSRIGYAKPDRRAFLTVSREHGVSPQHMLHIGDDWECDVLGAHSASISAIWISRGRTAPSSPSLAASNTLITEDLAAAAHHVHHLHERKRT